MSQGAGPAPQKRLGLRRGGRGPGRLRHVGFPSAPSASGRLPPGAARAPARGAWPRDRLPGKEPLQPAHAGTATAVGVQPEGPPRAAGGRGPLPLPALLTQKPRDRMSGDSSPTCVSSAYEAISTSPAVGGSWTLPSGAPSIVAAVSVSCERMSPPTGHGLGTGDKGLLCQLVQGPGHLGPQVGESCRNS